MRTLILTAALSLSTVSLAATAQEASTLLAPKGIREVGEVWPVRRMRHAGAPS
jgi:hypothetical protein